MKGKKILLGVTGSIAAYKSCEIIRLLIKEEAEVKVVMTESAARLISPLTLRTLSMNEVYCSLFQEVNASDVKHISLAEKADLLLIAPATANIIGKLAHGLADDLLSTVALATKAPIVMAPAMNEAMYENPIVRCNMKLLKDRDIRFIEPEVGELASGKAGKGRLADVGTIVDEVRSLLREKDFSGQTIIVSAGPTREPIDPVRYISNPSTGKMGFALAKAAMERGAKVILVTGPTHLAPPRNVKVIRVETALQMRKAILENFRRASIVVMSSAVANYRPKKKALMKIEKGKEKFVLELQENPDILKELGKKKGKKILVGFSLDTHDNIRRAKDKLLKKNLDLIVVSDPSAGFGVIEAKMRIVDREGNVEELPKLPKEKIAHLILDRVKKLS